MIKFYFQEADEEAKPETEPVSLEATPEEEPSEPETA